MKRMLGGDAAALPTNGAISVIRKIGSRVPQRQLGGFNESGITFDLLFMVGLFIYVFGIPIRQKSFFVGKFTR